jgi:hypothetical protein
MQITTEGRIFTAQLMREMRNCERLGAGTFHPGAKTWHEAMLGFRNSFIGCGGPVKASKIFARGRERLLTAHSKHGACYLNCFESRSRSGLFDMISWRVAQHPIRPGKYEGILISGNFCRLQRRGHISMYGKHHAFMSWHALGRLYERWDDGTIDKAAAVIGCVGVAGMLMSEGNRHSNNAMNLAFEGVHCAGVMRAVPKEYIFFDCLTVLPDEPKYAKQLDQGATVASAVLKFIGGDDPDPRGYAALVPVLPFTREDYVTQEIKDRAI